MTLLGAPVHKGKAQYKAIQNKIDDLSIAIKHSVPDRVKPVICNF